MKREIKPKREMELKREIKMKREAYSYSDICSCNDDRIEVFIQSGTESLILSARNIRLYLKSQPTVVPAKMTFDPVFSLVKSMAELTGAAMFESTI